MYRIKRPYTAVVVSNVYEALIEYKNYCLRCPRNDQGTCTAKLVHHSCMEEKDRLLDYIRNG